MLLQLKDVSKYYVTDCVFKNAVFTVNDTARIGVVGPNGAGKTTLLKVINGEESYDGEIFSRKNLTVGTLGQTHDYDGEKTVFETVLKHFDRVLEIEKKMRRLEKYMATDETAQDEYGRLLAEFERLGGYTVEARANAVLNGLGFTDSKEKPVKVLSGGEKTRLGLALILVNQPELLLLDEPTNHLDMEMLGWLEKYLADYRGGVIVVTHDRYFLDRICTEIIEVENQHVRHYSGSYSQYISRRETEREAEEKAWQAQREQLQEMQEFVDKNIVRASTSGRAKSRLKALEKIQPLERPEQRKNLKITMKMATPSGNDVLSLKNITLKVGGGRTLFEQLSLLIKRGERIAIIGPNGAGKTTLLKALAGRHKEYSGKIRWGENIKTYYYDQEQSCLNPQKTILEELRDDYPRLEEVQLRTLLGRLLFSGDDVFKKVAVLSGGEKARVALAKLLLTDTNTLVLDEPTNHIDIYCREVLEEALADYPGTLLFVSHDRYFIDKLATKTVEIRAGAVRIYNGGYQEYQRQRDKEPVVNNAVSRRNTVAGAEADDKPVTAGRLKTTAVKLQGVENTIARLERETAAIERELMRASEVCDQDRIAELYELLNRFRAELDKKMQEWEKLTQFIIDNEC